MLSGKIPIKPLEQDRQSSPENATFHKFYSTEYEIELLLQTKFEFIKRQQSSNLTKNERLSSVKTRRHDEART